MSDFGNELSSFDISSKNNNVYTGQMAGALAIDQSIPTLYCSCEAGPIQMEIDCLKRSIEDALHQSSEESNEFHNKSMEQQREIDILNAQIEESKERGDQIMCRYKDTKKGLKEIKMRIISKSNSNSSLTSMANLASSKQNSQQPRRSSFILTRPSSMASLGLTERNKNSLHNSSFSLKRPSLSGRAASSDLGSRPLLTRAYHSESILGCASQQDADPRVAEKRELKLKLEAKDRKITRLEGILDGNLKMINLLEQHTHADSRVVEKKALIRRLEVRDKEIARLEGMVDGNLNMIKLLEQKPIQKKLDSFF